MAQVRVAGGLDTVHSRRVFLFCLDAGDRVLQRHRREGVSTMAKSRKRKSTPKNALLPKERQPSPAKLSLCKRFLSRRAIVVESAGTVAALLAFWQVLMQTVPVIDLSRSNPYQPFSLPFTIKNDSPFSRCAGASGPAESGTKTIKAGYSIGTTTAGAQ